MEMKGSRSNTRPRFGTEGAYGKVRNVLGGADMKALRSQYKYFIYNPTTKYVIKAGNDLKEMKYFFGHMWTRKNSAVMLMDSKTGDCIATRYPVCARRNKYAINTAD